MEINPFESLPPPHLLNVRREVDEMLVSYSDSEGSGDDQAKSSIQKPVPKSTATSSASNFAIDRTTGKIKVSLQDTSASTSNGTHEDEPAAKRPRIGGGGAFSGFNAMLPAPKRDNLPTAQNGGNKAPARKVFGLRTGAEPAFSRESDAELRDLFAEQNKASDGQESGIKSTTPSTIPMPSFAKPAPPAPAGKAFTFKPLSVSRNTKKKKPTSTVPSTATATTQNIINDQPQSSPPPPVKKRVNLFSAGTDSNPVNATADYDDHNEDIEVEVEDENEDEIIEDLGPATQPTHSVDPEPRSLTAIANDLNLSASARRQLLGRPQKTSSHHHHHHHTARAVNVVNFNTDAEYASNQALISSGEQIQHNPVRAIASGKHSLRQLVTSAATQKDALEESFALGKRNKKEAGNRYGW